MTAKIIFIALLLVLLSSALIACGGGGDSGRPTPSRTPQAGPPPAMLVTASGEQTAGTGNFCWGGLCVDKIGMMIPANAATAQAGQPVKFNLLIEPLELTLAAWPYPSGRVVEEYGEYFAWLPEQEPSLRFEVPTQSSFEFTPDLPPGRYVVVLEVYASGGSVGYFFQLELLL